MNNLIVAIVFTIWMLLTITLVCTGFGIIILMEGDQLTKVEARSTWMTIGLRLFDKLMNDEVAEGSGETKKY